MSDQFTYISALDAYEGRCARSSTRPALWTPTQTLTHGQLWRQISKMAAGLEASGINAGDTVGVMLGRSPEHIIAMFACWWLGAIFVPLDPQLPHARQAFITQQADLKLIISPHHRSPRELLTHSPHQTRHSNLAHELAYIIFTSGSTGQPKGVMVEHRGIYNLLKAQIEAFALSETSRALWSLSPAFDASISDIGTTLLSGACLVLLPEALMYPIEQLAPRLSEHKITHLDFPPSLLGRLEPEQCGSLETLIIGGEACAVELVQRWAKHKRVINVYGPTEATICTSWVQCDQSWDKPALGALIPHMSWHILDEDDEPRGLAQPGELVLAGVGLARGYLDDEAMTAARFNMWRGQRIYRTGDRVVQEVQGEVVFLGRLDQQIKLRGQRMELQELELALSALPKVYASAVIKLDDPQPRLVAFVEGDASELTARQLRRQLALTLPVNMLPSAFYVLDALPRHANKKLDRGALRQLATQQPHDVVECDQGEQQAATAQERCLLQLWSEALGIEVTSVTQDLLALGADSMTILSVVARAAAHSIDISPAQWMRWPNIRDALTIQDDPTGQRLSDTRMSAHALMRDIAPLIQPQPSVSSYEPVALKTILLTGANGHLGVRLLRELLDRSEVKIIAGVRATSALERFERLDQALLAQGQPTLTDLERERIETLSLELGQPEFGLTGEQWGRLGQQIDTIIHCGARVHMLEGYERLRDVNVGGALTALKLAHSVPSRIKTLHAISTLSVFVATDRHEGVAREDDDLSQTQWIYGGYAQSKWAAERALHLSAPAALPLRHHRLGLVTADSISARAGEADFLLNFIRGVSALGAVPKLQDQDLAIDISPVDQVASALISLVLSEAPAMAQAYHLAGAKPLYLRELFELMRQEGVTLMELEPDAWVELAQPSAQAATAMLAMCRALKPEQFDRYRIMDLSQATRIRFDDRRVRAALNLERSPIDGAKEEIIRRYIRTTRA